MLKSQNYARTNFVPPRIKKISRLSATSDPGETYTDKKENQIFLIYKEIQSRVVAKSYLRKGFLIDEEMRKYFPIYEEAVSYI